MARPFDNSKNPKYSAILKELNDLSALQLQVYLCKNVKNMSGREVAEKLGIDEATVSRYNKTVSQTEFVKSMREDIMQLRPLIFEALIDNLKKKKEQTLNSCLKGMGIYEERLGFGKGDGLGSVSDDDLRKLILGYLFKEGKKEGSDRLQEYPNTPPKDTEKSTIDKKEDNDVL